MNNKKSIEITGAPIYPIVVGASAFIRESSGMRRTSAVLNVESFSRTEIRFETCNTNYLLHLVKEGVSV